MGTKQQSGDNSTNLQASGDIVITNTTALYSIEEVAKQLLNSAFGELPDETKKQIKQNQKSYFDVLSENLSKINKGNEELKKVIESPDFQYISKQASISASRSSSQDLHKNLSSLIAHRINNDEDDLKKIVYNEAITTLDKLTIDQIKIITLCYLLKYTCNKGIRSFKDYKDYFDNQLALFANYKENNSAYQHIEYCGCGSTGIGSWNLIDIHRYEYSELFIKPLTQEEIDSTGLSQELITALTTKRNNTYFFNLNNKNELEAYIEKNKIATEDSRKIMNLYEKSLKDHNEIQQLLTEAGGTMKDITDRWESSNLQHLSLTSVGIAIGASYFEQVTGNRIDIGIWIK